MLLLNALKKLSSVLLLCMVTSTAWAETATIAVAANFTKTIEEIGKAFEAQSDHQVRFSFGPTGKLYGQISQGAPFDAFFGADEKRPQKTIEDGVGIADSYFVYAQGQIVLFSWDERVDQNALAVLKKSNFKHLAIANPRTAPYGDRAIEFLKNRNLYQNVKDKLVNGESIAHAFQYVQTKNARIGFIAKSQAVDKDSPIYNKGYLWEVPPADYSPINQGALILKRGESNPAVKAFMAFIKGAEAAKIIQKFGYKKP